MTGPGAGASVPQEQAEPTCYRHPDRVSYVSCTRCGRHICGEDQIPAAVGFHCPDDVREANRGARQARTAYGGRVRQPGGTGLARGLSEAPVTSGLVAVNTFVFLITLLGGAALVLGSGSSPLYRDFAVQPYAIADGEYYRLLTGTFLHYGTLHLLLNMFALLQLGPELERALGRWRFLALYLLCGVGGAALTFATGPANAQAAGASGAIYGLAAAWFVLQRRRGADASPIYAFLVLGVVMTLAVPAIDWRGHAGGFLTGLACGAVLFIEQGGRRWWLQVAGLVAVAAVIVVVVAVRAADLSAALT